MRSSLDKHMQYQKYENYHQRLSVKRVVTNTSRVGNLEKEQERISKFCIGK